MQPQGLQYTQGQSAPSSKTVTLACLYTKQKTQKRKTWHDGRLVLHAYKAVLHDANPIPGAGNAPLAECDLSHSQRDVLARQHESCLETEQMLIQVEGPWTNARPTTSTQAPAPRVVSQGMQKVLSRKFQKPTPYIPPRLAQQQQSRQALGKRPRLAPLQPGELQRRYYGDAVTVHPPQPAPSPQPQGQAWHNAAQNCNHNFTSHNTIHLAPTNRQGIVPFQPVYQPRWNASSGQTPPELKDDQVRPTLTGMQSSTPVVGQPPASRTALAGAHDRSTLLPSNLSSPTEPTLIERTNQPAHSVFTSNSFDPSSFYGEEEEESDDGFPQQAHPWNGSAMRSSTTTHPSRAPGQVSDDYVVPSDQMEEEPEQREARTNVDKRQQERLSTSELLSAFGVGDTSALSVECPAANATFQRPEQIADKDAPELAGVFRLPSQSDSSSDEEN